MSYNIGYRGPYYVYAFMSDAMSIYILAEPEIFISALLNTKAQSIGLQKLRKFGVKKFLLTDI